MKDMPCCLGSGPSVTGTTAGLGIGKAAGSREKRREGKMNRLEILMVLLKVYRKA